MTIIREGRKLGNLIVSLPAGFGYSVVEGIIRNNTATARTLIDPLGYPLIAGTSNADYNFAVAGQEASVIALLLDLDGREQIEEAIAATTNYNLKWRILKNAPLIINRNQIRTTDIAGADFDVDAIVTALEALKWEVRDIPLHSETL